MTTLKISLLSAFATLFLLISMLASTGTASAHTASCQPQQNPACHPAYHPQLVVYYLTPTDNGHCEEGVVTGAGFAPGPVTLVAWRTFPFGGHFLYHTLMVWPKVETANADGSFSSIFTICGYGIGSPDATGMLFGIDSNGVWSNKVLV